MKKQIGEYRFLAGSARAGGTLWEGPDHLLYLEREGRLLLQTETPKRIDYSKIQCISYARTLTWWWATPLLALLPCLFVLAAYGSSSLPARTFNAILATLLGIGFLVHLLRGPTCVLKIQTAVQLHHIRPMRRLRPALQFAQQLGVLCRAHQADVSVGEEELAAISSTLPRETRLRTKTKLPFHGSVLLRWTLGVLLISGALLAGEPFVDHLGYLTLDLTVAMSALILTVMGAVQSGRFKLPPSLKLSLWGAMSNLGAVALFFFGLLVFKFTLQVMATKSPKQDFNPELNLELLRWFSHASFDELHQFAWGFVVLGSLSMILALLGLPAVIRKVTRPPTALPPPLPLNARGTHEASSQPDPVAETAP